MSDKAAKYEWLSLGVLSITSASLLWWIQNDRVPEDYHALVITLAGFLFAVFLILLSFSSKLTEIKRILAKE